MSASTGQLANHQFATSSVCGPSPWTHPSQTPLDGVAVLQDQIGYRIRQRGELVDRQYVAIFRRDDRTWSGGDRCRAARCRFSRRAAVDDARGQERGANDESRKSAPRTVRKKAHSRSAGTSYANVSGAEDREDEG
jgi:hypothetical protein